MTRTYDRWCHTAPPNDMPYLHKVLSDYTSLREHQHMITLNEEKKCPFLCKNKLCRLVLHHGDDILSETCTMFPREYHHFTTHTEASLMPGALRFWISGRCSHNFCFQKFLRLSRFPRKNRFCFKYGITFFRLYNVRITARSCHYWKAFIYCLNFRQLLCPGSYWQTTFLPKPRHNFRLPLLTWSFLRKTCCMNVMNATGSGCQLPERRSL